MKVPRKAKKPATRPRARRITASAPLSTRRYRELLAALTEGVVMVSSTGKVIAANPSAEAILGIKAPEIEKALRNDSVWRAVHEDGRPLPPEDFPLRKTLRTGKPQRNLRAGIRLGRRATRWLSVSTQPVFSGSRRAPAAVVASFEDVTQQRRVEAENARLLATVNASPDAITSTDLENRYISWNPGAERLFGYTAREALGEKAGWMIPEVKHRELHGYRDRVLRGETILNRESERIRKDGQHLFVESNYAPIRDAHGHVTGVVGVHRDVSPVKRMLMQLESSRELLRLALNGIPDVFVIYDRDLHVQFVNERGTEFFARSSQDIIGKRDEDLLPAEVTQTYQPLLARALATATTQSHEATFSLRGRSYSIAATYVPMVDEHGEIRQILGLMHDFTKRREVEERLAFMAQYDSLTGLPNRYLLLDRLDAAMQRARRNNTLLGIMFLDIDRFKQINDTRGHTAGDHLLRQIAQRLAGTLRATDTVARLGGDEFTVLVENASTAEEITSIAEKIRNVFSTPFNTESGEIFTTTSVGVTIYPFDDHDRDQLLKNADVAMYHAKQDRNAWQLFRPDMHVNSAGRLGMEIELRHALVRNEFELHYLPQLDVRSGALAGMEALLRWNNQELGAVSPADFIPLAEDTGLIVPIGEWILRAACEQCRQWDRAGLTPFPVSINIAGPQLRRGTLIQLISAMLTEYRLDPRWLALEFSESSIMRHAEETIRTLTDLRALGVSLAIDDFGTGFSNLGYLRRFPVNKIKVDVSYVRDIGSDPNDEAIVSAAVAMSKQLDIKTVAEGVETAAQLAYLAQLGCDEYQGYFFSKPIPGSDVLGLIESRDLKLARRA